MQGGVGCSSFRLFLAATAPAADFASFPFDHCFEILVVIGTGLVDAAPGSVKGLQLVVDDIELARSELRDRGVDVGDVQDFPWGRFVFFSDPDGNAWAIQQLPPRP